MKKIVVHEETLTKSYSAPRPSIAYLFVIACNVFALIVPFYLWNGPNGEFWITQGSLREQPDVSFLYKVIMVLEATSPTTEETTEIFVSTVDAVNFLRHDSFRMASIQFHNEDMNIDGMADWFTLEVDVPLNEDERVKSMQVLAFFNFRLKRRVKLDMETIVHSSVASDLPMSGYDTEGAFLFRQANPLGIRDYSSQLYANETPLVNTESEAVHRVSNSNVGDILARYRKRDVAADYVERYPIKRLDSGTPGDRSYRLQMKINVPQQDISYIPPLAEVLKDAWVKYFSVVVLCWLLLDRVKSFAFRHHLI
ncbi:hypothetical protein ACHAW6_011032 [Cyclotella cf. meneghiniana]